MIIAVFLWNEIYLLSNIEAVNITGSNYEVMYFVYLLLTLSSLSGKYSDFLSNIQHSWFLRIASL